MFLRTHLHFGIIYKNLTVYYKINFNPKQFIEELVDNQDTQSNAGGMRQSSSSQKSLRGNWRNESKVWVEGIRL